MAKKASGELEREVMEFLWQNGPSTGADLRAAVGHPRHLTDSTIRSVLRRLEAKRYVRRQTTGPLYVYSSLRAPRKAATEAVRDVLKKFCRGSLEELLAGLVDHRLVSGAELRRLAEKIETQEKKGKRS